MRELSTAAADRVLVRHRPSAPTSPARPSVHVQPFAGIPAPTARCGSRSVRSLSPPVPPLARPGARLHSLRQDWPSNGGSAIESSSWQTRCLSMPPTRKRPGSWWSAANRSRNSISNPPTGNSSGAISISQGHPRRAVAAGGLRRIWRQPPRIPGLQRNPPRLLPDPRRRPSGAARRGERATSARTKRTEERRRAQPPQRRPQARRATTAPHRRCASAEAQRRRQREAGPTSADLDERRRSRRAETIATTTSPAPATCRRGRHSAKSWPRRQHDEGAPTTDAAGRGSDEHQPMTRAAMTTTAASRRRHRRAIDGDGRRGARTIVEHGRRRTTRSRRCRSRRRRVRRQLQDPGSHQAPPDPAGAGRQGRARQQRRGADHLSVARRPLFGADAQHRRAAAASRARSPTRPTASG